MRQADDLAEVVLAVGGRVLVPGGERVLEGVERVRVRLPVPEVEAHDRPPDLVHRAELLPLVRVDGRAVPACISLSTLRTLNPICLDYLRSQTPFIDKHGLHITAVKSLLHTTGNSLPRAQYTGNKGNQGWRALHVETVDAQLGVVVHPLVDVRAVAEQRRHACRHGADALRGDILHMQLLRRTNKYPSQTLDDGQPIEHSLGAPPNSKPLFILTACSAPVRSCSLPARCMPVCRAASLRALQHLRLPLQELGALLLPMLA